MLDHLPADTVEFVARIRQGRGRVFRVGTEFALITELAARGCDRVDFRSETFLAGSAAVLVGHLLDEMRAARRDVSPGPDIGTLERSLDALPRPELQRTSSLLWRALARADLIESVIDCAAGQADYLTRRVAIHLPHGRDNAPYVVRDGGRNLKMLGTAATRIGLHWLLVRPDAGDLGAQRARFERRGPPQRVRWLEFRRRYPALAQEFAVRFGAPYFGERRRQARPADIKVASND